MSPSYASGGPDQTTAGGVLLLASSALAAVLMIAGLLYAAGTGPRHQAALAAAGCEPGLAPSGLPCTTAPAKQAHASTLTQLRSFNHQVQLASAMVQTQAKLILKALESPPQAG